MSAELQQAAVGAWLTARTGLRHAARQAEAVHGGSINRCVRWPGQGGDAFVKLAEPTNLPTYEAEADGLEALRAAAALRVPQVWPLASPATTPCSRSSGWTCHRSLPTRSRCRRSSASRSRGSTG
jgi:fructosamine-3-kinase